MSIPSHPHPTLLIVDDDPLILDSLSFLLAAEYEVMTASDRPQAINLVRSRDGNIDLALVDLGLPPCPHQADEGLALVGELLAHDPHTKITILSGQNEEASARHARTLGALDFVSKPARPDTLRAALARAASLRRREEVEAKSEPALQRLRGNTPPLLAVRDLIRHYASSRFPVLIEGESGSGKEIAALALHELSNANNSPFIALNCAAISPGLLEAHLFGHARGAFTGAVTAVPGYFEEAGAGTLFLDEIGELPSELQPKLLRVLETGEYQRVGETTRRKSRARIVAATNRDLRQEVRNRQFRTDLFHRLSVLRLTMPPLRTLGSDKELLLDHYSKEYALQTGSPAFELDAQARIAWQRYEFPGNVRELRNIIVRLLSRYSGRTVGVCELESEFETALSDSIPSSAVDGTSAAHGTAHGARDHLLQEGAVSLDSVLRQVEHDYISAALDLAHGNVSQAARFLGINRTTLYSRMETLSRYQSGTASAATPAVPTFNPGSSIRSRDT